MAPAIVFIRSYLGGVGADTRISVTRYGSVELAEVSVRSAGALSVRFHRNRICYPFLVGLPLERRDAAHLLGPRFPGDLRSGCHDDRLERLGSIYPDPSGWRAALDTVDLLVGPW